MKNIEYKNLLNIEKKSINPFSRESLTAKVKKEFGNGNFYWHDFGNGIASSICNYKVKENSNINLSSDISGAVIIFNLSNDIKYIFDNEKNFVLEKNSFFLGLSSNQFKTQINLKKNLNYNSITIGIKEKLFLELAQKLNNLNSKMTESKNHNYSIMQGGLIDSIQLDMLNHINKNNKDESLLSNLNLESLCTKLIYYTLGKIMNPKDDPTLSIDKIESLKKAKDIILTQYHLQLSIKDIANKSATNECYLKKDFKQYYNMTIYQMLKEQRLKEAKKLLEKEISVKEVCLKVGYKHTGNFSKLFFDKFGISPSLYKKQYNY
ncbi:AraC family transcriptional regulator [Malaciobacter molluscorum LMG 25693]|uniref:AraC family transcriptional regulator n=1 Tax=Malaciobacter molluscorum LMG 25693 TaxID=870501 RepID=A0A2G1DK20_9BACT|nr:AraC family transcriptional regulator [Malaciobacter molluscorum]AXX91403.1 transcriptional regulator, AraC family [Malaciobacter molluscorum LMG 25693]PHO18848.1 AraC family transcriptional regulator [Malaciobacter molluscorum LMG 25693]